MKIMYIFFWSTLTFLTFVIFLLNNFHPGKYTALCLCLQEATSNWQASVCVGVSCKTAGFATVRFSAQHVCHRNHREMSGAYQDFLFRLHVTAE